MFCHWWKQILQAVVKVGFYAMRCGVGHRMRFLSPSCVHGVQSNKECVVIYKCIKGCDLFRAYLIS